MRTDDRRRLTEQRNRSITDMQEMNGAAERERRSFTSDEQQRWNALEAEIRRIDLDLGGAPQRSSGSPVTVAGGDHRGRQTRALTLTRDESLAAEYRGARFCDTVDVDGGDEDFNLGRLVRGMVTSRWDDAELEQRALSNASNAGGGFLSPEPIANYVIDRVRNKLRVVEAGAQTVPMGSDQFAIPRLAGGVTPAWRNENAPVAESDSTWERVTFTARTVAVIQRISYELVQDLTPEGADIIERELLQAIAAEIDRVALRGSGTAPEPRGVRNQTGVSVLANGADGAAATYDQLVLAAATVAGNGFTPGPFIANSRLQRSLAGLKDTTGQYLAAPSYLTDMPILDTNQVPTNLTTGTSTDTSEVYSGQWDQLLLGFRPQIGIEIQRSGGSDGMVGLKTSDQRYIDSMQIGVLVFARVDVQLGQPAAFAIQTGVRP